MTRSQDGRGFAPIHNCNGRRRCAAVVSWSSLQCQTFSYAVWCGIWDKEDFESAMKLMLAANVKSLGLKRQAVNGRFANVGKVYRPRKSSRPNYFFYSLDRNSRTKSNSWQGANNIILKARSCPRDFSLQNEYFPTRTICHW